MDDALDVEGRDILDLTCLCHGTTFKDYGWYGGGGVVSVAVLFSNNGSSACSELPASAKVELFSSAKYNTPELLLKWIRSMTQVTYINLK